MFVNVCVPASIDNPGLSFADEDIMPLKVSLFAAVIFNLLRPRATEPEPVSLVTLDPLLEFAPLPESTVVVTPEISNVPST